MYFEKLKEYKGGLKEFRPYADITSRESFGSLNSEWKKEAIKLAESYENYRFEPMYASDFMDFTLTGNRVRYEDKLFNKRQALNALTLAECIEDKGRFLTKIIDGIFSICEETAWQLPAHNSYIRDTPQLILPDSTEPVLDLFACEAGAVLATVKYLLKDRLDKISPFIVKRIDYELEHRIINPYLNRHFWWMGKGEERMCNWTIWCTQNVLLSAFLGSNLIREDNERAKAIIEKACKSIDYFLKDYGDDGCCDEGAQYYRHAGLCLFNTTEVLNAVCDNQFLCLYENEKIKNIASFIEKVHVDGKYYINFADCSAVAGRCGSREYLFAKRIGNQQMQKLAAGDFNDSMPDGLMLKKENNLYYRLQNAFTVNEIFKFANEMKPENKSTDSISETTVCDMSVQLYESTGLYIVKDDIYCLGAKAGHNDDSHNHNDTGSFTVYKNGQPVFIDVGVESYSRKTFSPDRYTIWTMQSAYHNLPTINGCMQHDGREFAAKNVKAACVEGMFEVAMDISDAYPEDAGVSKYERNIRFVAGKGITVKDSFYLDCSENQKLQENAESAVQLSLMTYEKPELISDNSVEKSLILSIGDISEVKVTGARLDRIEEIPIEDVRLKTAWDHNIYRIILDISSGFELRV